MSPDCSVGMEKLIEDSDLVPEPQPQVSLLYHDMCVCVCVCYVCMSVYAASTISWCLKGLVVRLQQCTLGKERVADWQGLLPVTPQGEMM